MYFLFNRPLNHFDTAISLREKSRRPQAFWTDVFFLITAEKTGMPFLPLQWKETCYFASECYYLLHWTFGSKKRGEYHKLYSWHYSKIKLDKTLWKDSEIATGSDHIKSAEQESQCTHADNFLGVLAKDEVTVLLPRNQEIP